MAQIEAITKGKVSLVTDHPFFGSLALRYPCDEAAWCPTMATDGKVIVYNKAWTESLNRDEVTAVLAHEVCHIAFLHHVRRGDRHPRLWNIAGDYVINLILQESGFKLPANGLLDPKYAGLTTEKVYDMLIDDIRSGKIKVVYSPNGYPIPGLEGPGGDDGEPKPGENNGKAKATIKEQDWGAVTDMPGAQDASVRAAEEAEMKVRVLQAAATAKSKGKLPSAFEGLLDKYKQSKVNWRERLRTFIGGNKPDDYSFRRPNRKHMAMSSVYLPTVEYVGCGVVVVMVDSSGSVSDAELAQFLAEMRAIHNEMKPDTTHVVWCDTRIAHVQEYSSYEEFDDNKRYACGGTQLRPAFEWIEQNGIQPNSVIFFSDLEIFDDDLKGIVPWYPMLWVSSGRTEAPFGEVLKIEI